MSKIKTWNERCEEHPDHQTGMVSNSMIQARMQEEIDELRAALAETVEPVQEPAKFLDVVTYTGTGVNCAALAEPLPLYGWVFKRNADGTVGIFAPPPRPGESQRTSDCVGPGQRDLHELLGKLADHMAALAEPVAYSEGRTLHWHDGKGVNDAQLYLAPPQRKPLSEDEKRALADKFLSCQPESYEVSGVFDLISAVERAHGITP